MGVQMIGKCDSCGSEETKLTSIRIVSGTFCGGLKVAAHHLCFQCKTKEFFYLDDHDAVKYNNITTEIKAAIDNNGDDR